MKLRSTSLLVLAVSGLIQFMNPDTAGAEIQVVDDLGV